MRRVILNSHQALLDILRRLEATIIFKIFGSGQSSVRNLVGRVLKMALYLILCHSASPVILRRYEVQVVSAH